MSRGGKKKGGERTLTQELAAFLKKTLVPDLRERAKVAAVRGALEKRYLHEKAQSRTAEHFEGWVERTVEQVGAAWVLSCLFVRTLEDRGLLDHRRLAGPGAADSEQLFFELTPALTARDYLLTAFRELARLPAGDAVMDPRYNPVWRLSPSHDAARALLDFFRTPDAQGALRWTFGGTDTRFLGDVYQDLSEAVRERYALLQTPHFVERFILDLTLEPAIGEFGLEKVRVIDPTCGSGHFLLGAFERLFEHRQRTAPGLDVKAHAGEALKQVYGVDLNPYAVAIARFRLTLAFLEKAGIAKLKRAPRLPLNLVVADSLLYGGRHQQKLSELDEDKGRWGDEVFDLEDAGEARRIFGLRYHAVVGNPPYITCKDAALRDAYRQRYDSCYREFALAAPFTERFFDLAEEEGFVGLINANSFMKREFGKRLIEQVLPRYELTRVIDTSGAYIPGHGTPTVLLFGRNRKALADKVDAILGRRGEPTTPEDAEKGLVWTSIAENFDDGKGFENEFITVTKMARSSFAKHPWSLGGGGASDLKERLEREAPGRLADLVDSIGFGCITKQDDVFSHPRGVLARFRCEPQYVRPFVIGEHVRDWLIRSDTEVVYPYGHEIKPVADSAIPAISRFLWPYRQVLLDRKVFGGANYRDAGRVWYEYGQIPADKYRVPLSISYAFVATHNHFVLDRGGKMFKQSAPIIKLPEGAMEDDHLALLGYLNSSTACFWMKQVFAPKGMHNGSEANATPFLVRFEFDGTKLAKLPIPRALNERLRARYIDLTSRVVAAQDTRIRLDFASLVSGGPGGADLGARIDALLAARSTARAEAIAAQEELDWLTYHAWGWVGDDTLVEGDPEALEMGERPFEIALGQDGTNREGAEWFRWNETRPAPGVPERLSASVRRVLQRRMDYIRSDTTIRFLESPEFKRRWVQPSGKAAQELESDEKMLKDQARQWLCDCIEAIVRQQEVRPVSVRSVVELALTQLEVQEVVGWLLRDDQMDAAALIQELVEEDAAAFVAAHRFTDTGLEKFALWLEVWALQRHEDAGASSNIPVPPKYEMEDFRRQALWRRRGKYDVAHERYIAYPGAERDDQQSLLIGWAGWDHLQRATALAALYQERKTQDGWEAERLTPLLAGLLELVPWLQQWHNAPDPEFNGERLGDYYAQFVDSEARALGLSLDQLRAWRPSAGPARKKPVRRKKAASAEDAA